MEHADICGSRSSCVRSRPQNGEAVSRCRFEIVQPGTGRQTHAKTNKQDFAFLVVWGRLLRRISMQ